MQWRKVNYFILNSHSYGPGYAGGPPPHFKPSKHQPPRNYYPSFSYATNYYIPKAQHTASFPRRPQPNMRKAPKNKVVHIHGTNGAKFNGTNFFGTREPTCTYEEWHNPSSAYNTQINAEKLEKRIKRSRSNNSARSATTTTVHHTNGHNVHNGHSHHAGAPPPHPPRIGKQGWTRSDFQAAS